MSLHAKIILGVLAWFVLLGLFAYRCYKTGYGRAQERGPRK